MIGHQFGYWAGQLGDGRAICLGELRDKQQQRLELCLKGAGKTPYSRRGDGRAVLRSSIREYLASEAMYYLGIPTTRSLSLVTTEETTKRDPLYNGTVINEKMAIVARVAPNFIRFGSFERVFYQNRPDLVLMLANYTVFHYFPHLLEISESTRFHEFFYEVARRTAILVAKWQSVGFTHGVLNTDNMSILGLTIDYGPFGFLDGFNPDYTPNGSDDEGRYSFKNQPSICRWNLQKLAIALSPLFGEDETGVTSRGLHVFDEAFESTYYEIFSQKIGLGSSSPNKELIDELLHVIVGADFTLFFRRLAKIKILDVVCFDNEWIQNQESFFDVLRLLPPDRLVRFYSWFNQYLTEMRRVDMKDDVREKEMNKLNPAIVLRTWIAQRVISEVEQGDLSLLEQTFGLLRTPYEENDSEFYNLPPTWATDLRLTCSS
eukprot:TRINITY_DN5819_c0_g1_i4.p1 TRINITY_DN5819_c0_g1~~TRINITY_DN5819_c0_g1_i4.p1  ORF type:complete len:433 (-),score=69.40 TRINITY_DN5819_c0_g1_i4:152-1450(-)